MNTLVALIALQHRRVDAAELTLASAKAELARCEDERADGQRRLDVHTAHVREERRSKFEKLASQVVQRSRLDDMHAELGSLRLENLAMQQEVARLVQQVERVRQQVEQARSDLAAQQRRQHKLSLWQQEHQAQAQRLAVQAEDLAIDEAAEMARLPHLVGLHRDARGGR